MIHDQTAYNEAELLIDLINAYERRTYQIELPGTGSSQKTVLPLMH